jgi:hypothetical protein
MSAPKRVIEVTVVKVKPKFWQEYKKGVATGAAIWQKHGAKILGIYLTEAGPSNEIIFVAEWPSIDARLNVVAKIHQDADWKPMADRAHFIYGKETYLCYARSKVPMQPFPADQRIMMKKYNLHGNSYFCENKFIELAMARKEHDPNFQGPLAVLHPVSASTFGMLVFFAQPGGSIDAGQERWYKFVSDPKNWPKLCDAYTKYSEKSSRILAPFKAQ